MKKLFAILLLLSGFAAAQINNGGGGGVSSGATLPATCVVGDVFFKTTATIGLHQCLTANNWTTIGGTGSMTWPSSAGIAVYGGSNSWGTSITWNSGTGTATLNITGNAGGTASGNELPLTFGAGLNRATNAISTDSSTQNFVKAGALTCGASTNGKVQVHTTPLQYCDNAATPALKYAAYGDSAGKASSAATADSATNGVTASGNYTSGQFVKAAGNDKTTSSALIVAADVPATPVSIAATTHTMTAPREYFFCNTATTCSVTLPVPAVGDEFCIRSDNNISAAITLAARTNIFYEKTDRTGWGSTGGTLVSGAAVTNQICVIGYDATHYAVMSSVGTWTAN